ncbi:MAG: cytochrome c [Hyphomicrobiales bacterium]
MKAIWFLILAVFGWTCGVARADEVPGSAARGKVLYERYCNSCHGPRGDGRGESAEWLAVKPRDFRQGVFKWRSTPSGSLPLVSDIDKTIRDGVYGTSMPPWYEIGHKARLDVIAYLQTFSARWKTEQPDSAIVIPPETPFTEASVERGKAVFQENECAKCHGDEGHGDGPASMTLRDDWGNPIVPYDLTKGHLKGGSTPRDIYRVFMTGLSGTPMPDYSRATDPAQAWDLVHYIESISGTEPTLAKK